MPKIPGSESLGSPNVPRGTRPIITGADTGAGMVGRGMERIGATVSAIGEEERQREDALDLIKADNDLQEGLRATRREFETDPDYKTYGPRFDEKVSPLLDSSASKIRNPNTRAKFLERGKGQIIGTRESVLHRGLGLEREHKEIEVENELSRSQGSYAATRDPAERQRILQGMLEKATLAERTGLVRPKAAERYRDQFVDGTIALDIEERLYDDPEGVLRDLGMVPGGRKPVALTAPGAAGDLGSVSAKYESGGRGAGFVSTGKDDPGGPSYGVHQLSSKDSMPAFLRSEEGKAYAERFGGARPGTAAFNRTYSQIASEDADGLAKAQKAFYTRTHYQPALEAAKAAGFDVEDRGVQEALFSIGVQHGGAQKIIGAATAAGSAHDQIKSLYRERVRYVSGLTDLPDNTKRSVLNRYGDEVRDVLALAGKRDGGPAAEEADPAPDTIQWGEPLEPPTAEDAASPTRSQYAMLSGKRRQVMINKARIALSHTYQRRLADDFARVEDGGEEERGADGKTAFERAAPILQPNVLAQWKTKRDKAFLKRDALKAMENMPEDQMEDHIAGIGRVRKTVRDPLTGQQREVIGEERSDIGYAEIKAVRDQADAKREKILTKRRSDPASAVAQSSEVQRAVAAMNSGSGSQVRVSLDENGDPTVVATDIPPAEQRTARRAVVEASLEAQRKLGISDRRHISKEGARRLLSISKSATPDEFRDGLVRAARKAGDEYGPDMGEKVFRDALVLANPGIGREKLDEYASEGSSPLIAQKKAEARADLLAKQMFGRTISDADMEKLRHQDQWLRTIGQGPDFSGRSGLNQGRPGIDQRPPQIPQQRQPSEAHIKLLTQQMAVDPVKAREIFDSKFGEGAAKRVMNRMIEGEMQSP